MSSDEVALSQYCASHGWEELSDAVEARLVLTSKCILISSKILKQLKSPENHQNGNGKQLEMSERATPAETQKLTENLQESVVHAASSLSDIKVILRRLQQIYDSTSDKQAKSRQKTSKNRLIKAFNELQKQYKSMLKQAGTRLQADASLTSVASDGRDGKSSTPTSSSLASTGRRANGTNSSSSSRNRNQNTSSTSQDGDYDTEFTSLTRSGPGSLYQYQSGWTLAEHSQVEQIEYEATERQEFIKEIERDVHAVNEMFKDLNSMVHEQQFLIDSIESNIMETTAKAHQALEELKKAEINQKAKRRNQCCLMFMIALAILVLLLMIWVLLN